MSSTQTHAPAVAVSAVTADAACRNCGAARHGDYCHACGQHFLEARLSFGLLLTELLRNLSLDRGILLTIRELTLDPGGMISRYLAGQRRRYTGPLAYLFFGAALMLLTYPVYAEVMNQHIAASTMQTQSGSHPLFTPAQAEAFRDLTIRLTQMTTLGGIAMAIPFAVFVRLFFRRQGLNLAEASIFALFVCGHSFVVQSALAPVWALFGVGAVFYMAVAYATVFWVAVHASATLFDRPLWSGFKGLLAMTLSNVVWAILISVGLMMFVLTFR